MSIINGGWGEGGGVKTDIVVKPIRTLSSRPESKTGRVYGFLKLLLLLESTVFSSSFRDSATFVHDSNNVAVLYTGRARGGAKIGGPDKVGTVIKK